MNLRISEEEAGRWADEHYLEQLKSKLGKLEREKESYFASREGSHPQVRKIDQQISKIKKEIKRMTQDSQELEAAQELFSAFKSKLTDEKTYQSGEHVKVVNKNNGEKMELKVLKDNHDGTLEAKAPTGAVITIKKTWIVDNDLGVLFRDAYDPAKYEGTREHQKNLWNLEGSLESFRGRAKTSKERIAKLRNMVSSGKYGSATARELKEEEREYENILMKIQQVRSMLQRMKGQKDSCATKDSYDFGDETMTTKEAKEYWDKYHNSDPILKGYKTFEAWYRESKMNGYIKDGYNWEEPKVIEAKIKELEEDIKKGKFVDPNYLAGIKRALEMAKKERATKDSMEMLKLVGLDAGTYQVVHREGDFKVVQTNEGFEVYYLGVYHDTFHTKEQALGFINKFNERAKARNKDASPYQIGDEVWVRYKGDKVKCKILRLTDLNAYVYCYYFDTTNWVKISDIAEKA